MILRQEETNLLRPQASLGSPEVSNPSMEFILIDGCPWSPCFPDPENPPCLSNGDSGNNLPDDDETLPPNDDRTEPPDNQPNLSDNGEQTDGESEEEDKKDEEDRGNNSQPLTPWLDLDCDSDNTGKVDENQEEEQNEEKTPGAVIHTNGKKELIAKVLKTIGEQTYTGKEIKDGKEVEVKINVRKVLKKVELNWVETDKVKVWETSNLLSSPTVWTASTFRKVLSVEGLSEGTVWFTLRGTGRQEITKTYPDGTKTTEVKENVEIASDKIVMTVMNLGVLLTIYPDETSELSADDGEAFIVLGVWVYDPQTDSWKEAKDGTVVQWKLIQGENQGSLNPTQSQTQGGFAITKLTTNRKAGTTYSINARVIKLADMETPFEYPPSITSAPITVVPGKASKVNLAIRIPFLPATNYSQTTLTAQFFDYWDNPVVDGSPVTIFINGLSQVVGGNVAYTKNGIIQKTIQSGFLRNIDNITVELDGLQESVQLELRSLQVFVDVDPPVLTVASGETATVVVRVTDAHGIPVPDGTPVYLFSSAGSVFPRESFTINGFAFARLSTSSYRDGEPTPLHEWVGDVLVTAVVPGNFVGSTYVRFAKKPDALLLRPRHRFLAGDVSESGFEQVEQIDGSLRPIPCEAETIVDIFGKANERVTVSVDKEHLAYLINPVTGEVGKSLTVTLDGNGEGLVFLVSKGQLTNLQEEITLTVTSASNPTSPSAEPKILLAAERESKAKVWLGKKEVLVPLKNLVLGFVWGESPGLAGAGGDILASFFVYGDIRDIVKELGKAILPGGQDADWVVFGFAVAGLVSNIVPQIDSFIGAAKALFKVIRRLGPPAKDFSNFLVDAIKFVWKNQLWDKPEGQRLLRLMKVLVLEGEETIRVIAQIASDTNIFKGLEEIAGRLDDASFSDLVKKLKRVTEEDPNFGIGAARRAMVVLRLIQSDDVVKELIKSPTAIDDIAKITKSISIDNLSKALENAKLFTNAYTRSDLLKDAAKISNARGLERIIEVFKRSTNVDELRGALFELQAAAVQGEKVMEMRKGIKTTHGSTDVDFVLANGTFVEVKLGDFLPANSAQLHKMKGEIGQQIAKFREFGAKYVKFVFRKGAQIDERILDYLQEQKVIVEYIPYRGP
ncbi:MAG: hypothetical protein RMK94_14395 [Armatimonadota bacterium]|nr:hypothetical protein [Armatimonadota bacterium]